MTNPATETAPTTTADSESVSEAVETAPTENVETDALAEAPAHHVNSVDATAHQPMVARVMDRKVELEALLGGLDAKDTGTRDDIEAALALITQMLSGDLTAVPAVVVVDMNRWLERTKHLGERSAPMAAPSA